MTLSRSQIEEALQPDSAQWLVDEYPMVEPIVAAARAVLSAPTAYITSAHATKKTTTIELTMDREAAREFVREHLGKTRLALVPMEEDEDV